MPDNNNVVFNPEPTVGAVIASSADFMVVISTMPSEDEDLIVYGVYNTDTEVREAETRTYYGAVSIMRQLQDQMDDLNAEAEIETDMAEALGVSEEVDNPVH